MSPLNNHQKQLLFDYCIGLTSEKETAEAEAMISDSQEAADIHSKLKAALAPLDAIRLQPCPNELAERTILRLNNLARSSQIQLEQLLAGEQAKSAAVKGTFWRSLSKIATAAAVFLVAWGTFQTSANYVRHRYRRNRCQAQLGNIFRGLGGYVADNDGKLPVIVTTAGSPWWMVGRPGTEDYSNTRCMWRLVKGDYVGPADFVCPGREQKRVIRFELEVKKYNDFPGRQYITYSTRICCKEPTVEMLAKKVLMADLSPLFEALPQDFSKGLDIQVDRELLNVNSSNHNYAGQNILLGDGSIRFLKTRFFGITQDDIYTLQNILFYNGTERPSCEEDSFNAP